MVFVLFYMVCVLFYMARVSCYKGLCYVFFFVCSACVDLGSSLCFLCVLCDVFFVG